MNLIKKLFYIFLPIVVGSIIGTLTSSNINYSDLVKPTFSPSSYVFPIAWTIIYLLMGISYCLLKSNTNNTKKESYIYYLQLIVNALWSIIFFNLEWRFFAIIWIIILDLLVIYMVYLFYKKYKLSAYLNIIYIIWLALATYLTIGIYILN